MTQDALLPCPYGTCPSLELATRIKCALDMSPMAIRHEKVAVYLDGYEKQALRKILWHYRTHTARTPVPQCEQPAARAEDCGKCFYNPETGYGEICDAHIPKLSDAQLNAAADDISRASVINDELIGIFRNGLMELKPDVPFAAFIDDHFNNLIVKYLYWKGLAEAATNGDSHE